ncbi:MAG: argininosuccinate lyase, partial [Ruminiclostridium sp.]|nr:argininosuccinate lyase [Ruminiclostridium sp.]
GRVYGSLITLLTVMKGIPLAYNKDMQEDKECVFDAIDTVKMCLPVFASMIETMTVKPENMRRAALDGCFINATDCADYLVKKGLPFREAYMVVGKLVHTCIEQGENLDTLTLEEFREVSDLFQEDIYQALYMKNCVNGRKAIGGPAAVEVARQIAAIEAFVAERQ